MTALLEKQNSANLNHNQGQYDLGLNCLIKPFYLKYLGGGGGGGGNNIYKTNSTFVSTVKVTLNF